jgi:hypothetical protein
MKGQLVVMQQQVKEMQSGSTDTHELAVQAKKQADRTKDVADSALEQSRATNALATEAKRSANAAMNANAIATKSLIQIEKANITVGKPDGIAAEFIMPPDPKEKAQLVVYFQNSGRSPAKFSWGNESSVIAELPADPKVIKNSVDIFMKNSIVLETDHVFQPMWRAKNRKTGEIKWSGTIMIAGNSSYQGVLWELPKERLSQLLNMDVPFLATGNFEFCDGFGNRVCRQFVLTHPHQFHNRLFLAYEDECPEWRMQAIPTFPDFDFLPACAVQEQREELKGAFPNLPKPQ